MIVIGVVLLVLSAMLTAGISLFNSEASNASAFGVSLTNVSIGGLFLTGVVTGVVGALGIGLVLVGAARKRSKRVSTKRQVRSARSEAETLAEENARLQGQLERERTTTVRPGDDGRGPVGDGRADVSRADDSRGPVGDGRMDDSRVDDSRERDGRPGDDRVGERRDRP